MASNSSDGSVECGSVCSSPIRRFSPCSDSVTCRRERPVEARELDLQRRLISGIRLTRFGASMMDSIVSCVRPSTRDTAALTASDTVNKYLRHWIGPTALQRGLTSYSVLLQCSYGRQRYAFFGAAWSPTHRPNRMRPPTRPSLPPSRAAFHSLHVHY